MTIHSILMSSFTEYLPGRIRRIGIIAKRKTIEPGINRAARRLPCPSTSSGTVQPKGDQHLMGLIFLHPAVVVVE
jgi:hypothetical protein